MRILKLLCRLVALLGDSSHHTHPHDTYLGPQLEEISNQQNELSKAINILQSIIIQLEQANSARPNVLDLHIHEYDALRAEQRTRLDSASKILNYYLIVIGATIAGLVSVYNVTCTTEFTPILQIVLLLIPFISLPFAFAQQNEEIIVRNIGDYFDTIKEKTEDQGRFLAVGKGP